VSAIGTIGYNRRPYVPLWLFRLATVAYWRWIADPKTLAGSLTVSSTSECVGEQPAEELSCDTAKNWTVH